MAIHVLVETLRGVEGGRAAARPHRWARGWGGESQRAAGDKEEGKIHRAQLIPSFPEKKAEASRGCSVGEGNARCLLQMPSAVLPQPLRHRAAGFLLPPGPKEATGFQVTYSELCGNPSTTWKWIMKVISKLLKSQTHTAWSLALNKLLISREVTTLTSLGYNYFYNWTNSELWNAGIINLGLIILDSRSSAGQKAAHSITFQLLCLK